MRRKAVIVLKGKKFNICCDVDFLPELMAYLLKDLQHMQELKLIFGQILEGLKSSKYSDEPFGTKAMKPFKNRQNDRIICNVTKRHGQTQCIVMTELYEQKKSNTVDKKLQTRYKIVSKYKYEIIE